MKHFEEMCALGTISTNAMMISFTMRRKDDKVWWHYPRAASIWDTSTSVEVPGL